MSSDPEDWGHIASLHAVAVDNHVARRANPEAFLLQRLAMALLLTMEEMVDPVRSGAIAPHSDDARRFEKGRRFAEGWDAAVDHVNARLNELLFRIDDRGLPWPFDLDSFSNDFSKVYKKG